MNKICVIGAFDFENKATGGQPVKTRELYYALVEVYGKENVDYIELYRWKKNICHILYSLNQYSKKCKTIIMLPASNGVTPLAVLLASLKKIRRNKIYYDVIGGWLTDKLTQNYLLRKSLSCFDGIWVESSLMKKNMNDIGLNNVEVIPNFKTLNVIDNKKIKKTFDLPLPICTFSRVIKEKGIGLAIEAVSRINERFNTVKYKLDIYGPVSDDYSVEFHNLLIKYKDYVRYCGIIEPNKSSTVLKEYFLLLFPTYYEGEGMAGTIIDALSVGLPIIASNWHFNSEIINDNYNGFLCKTKSIDDLFEKLLWCYENQDAVIKMRENCLAEYMKYSKPVVVQQIISQIHK